MDIKNTPLQVNEFYRLMTPRGIPRAVHLKWISPDGKYVEITYGYSGTKRHRIPAKELLPFD